MTSKPSTKESAAKYNAALAKLKLTPYKAARLLGISLSQSHRYASGEQPVKKTVALLLTMYLRHGIPDGW